MDTEVKGYSRDFVLVVIGQIISLFGNAVIRFAMPLYLLNLTGSSALFGTVMAFAFIPAIILSPVGGLIADRVNKRNIMVALDFFTSLLLLIFSFLLGEVNPVVLIAVTMMILYGIAGAYEPAVQASLPVLVGRDYLLRANAIINTIGSFSALLGPVLGGLLYSAYGLIPVLWLCIGCFFLSAVMELFIHIPYKKQSFGGRLWKGVASDFSESLNFIRKRKPVIGQVIFMVCAINLFMSSMLSVGLPYVVTEVLDFPDVLANRLYSLSEGAVAGGGLAGGILAGVFAERLKFEQGGNLIIGCTVCLFPMAIALIIPVTEMTVYLVLLVCHTFLMIFSSVFSIECIAFVQQETPQNMVGKVISVVFTISMCAQPLGNALYGVLFELFSAREWIVFLFAGVVSLFIALKSRNIFKTYKKPNG